MQIPAFPFWSMPMSRFPSSFPLVCVVALAGLCAQPVGAQDYGSGWLDVAQGMRQNMGQQEALRDRMRMANASNKAAQKRDVTRSRADAPRTRPSNDAQPADPATEGLFAQAAASVMRVARSKGPPPASDVSPARFQSSSRVRDRVVQRFVALLDQSDGLERDQIRAFLESGSLKRDFDAVLDKFGFDKHNLADVVSAYYIGMWEVGNGRYMSDQQARAVRAALAPALVRDTNLGALSQEQKQEAAETYTLLVMLAILNQQVLDKQGQASAAKVFREGVYKGVLRQGVDLRRLDVGTNGFVLR